MRSQDRALNSNASRGKNDVIFSKRQTIITQCVTSRASAVQEVLDNGKEQELQPSSAKRY